MITHYILAWAIFVAITALFVLLLIVLYTLWVILSYSEDVTNPKGTKYDGDCSDIKEMF